MDGVRVLILLVEDLISGRKVVVERQDLTLIFFVGDWVDAGADRGRRELSGNH